MAASTGSQKFAGKRILVYIQSIAQNKLNQAQFTESIFNHFTCEGNITDVCARLHENRLVVSEPVKKDDEYVRLRRPSFCPIHCMRQEERNELPDSVLNRGVDTGAAVLLESCDGKILLTRRAKHLRIFPGTWVPPGGHLELNESISEAGLRELEEETGLKVTNDICSMGKVPIIGLWESSYPYRLSRGLPTRHHIVIYLHAKLIAPFTAEKMNTFLHPSRDETDAAAWLDRDVIKAIVETDEESGKDASQDILSKLPNTFRATVVDESNTYQVKDLPLLPLLNKAPDTGDDIERVSTGTKFALGEWLRITSRIS
ncbi:nucleoside diphosphate-linked moiety X motif 17-like [Lineus longissimus]|uniref:nucleoside diphosphate-linked moiety X motif 17-like n=1 Tax=Lineus longissimus TaxID=88925 RepID=UPI002B4DC804